MIIVRLIGGLGNQMFQYALGRVLSLKWHSDLYLDLTHLTTPPPNITPRRYALDKFNIEADIASSGLLKQVPFSQKEIFLIGFRNFFTRKAIFQYVKEPTVNFNRGMLDLPDNVYLEGYWQSEKYFAGISDVIRQDFIILPNPSERNQKILDEIQECNSVSVHVRRGDYITNPETRRIHFVCDEEYYRKALEIIMKQIKNPHIFVFSDDTDWTDNHIMPDAPVTYITHNIDKQSYEDMRLMMHCRHHIIANSSFSWWGAWLGKKPGQLVVAPSRWYNTKLCNYSDRLPSDWIITI
ncbi:MAG: alpha-1,2-fucosyltransferase [Methanoregula sp.]|jgi:hypothetical protein|uniref:alpha-1,2-fucosyltransferase n=1 Tax=Methanoregula sp. TaxID=2052170 RepID=UPI003C2239B9